MKTIEADVVVVGTGPGGASVAKDLVKAGKKVCILESGRDVPPTSSAISGALAYVGGLPKALSLRRGLMLTPEWLLVLRGTTTGGSSMLYLGTAFDPDPKLWAPFGVDLADETKAIKEELQIGPLPDHLIGAGVHHLGEVARGLGYDWRKLNKLIKPEQCRENCNLCVYGCRWGAKWHSRDWVMDAVSGGAQLKNEYRVEKVLRRGSQAVGVEGRLGDG
ncbi:MAG: FAD-binding protein, partial [Proteobacteria bacterium]|nr:FAD-binding protein [Pseudomonadota bacterium]